MASPRSLLRQIIYKTPSGPRRLIGRILALLHIRLDTGFERHGHIHKSASLEDRHWITVDSTADIGEYCILRAYEAPIVIGARSSLGPFCVVHGGTGVTIGEDVMFGPYVMVASGNHSIKRGPKAMRWAECVTDGPIVVEDDVWVGAHAVICDGVHIATGCVIAAGAVLTKSTEPYGVYAGVPARRISERPE